MTEPTCEELAAEAIQKLKGLRDDYSDEIPAEIVHSSSKNDKYKVRGAWWGRLEMARWRLQHDGLLPENLNETFNKLWRDYHAHQAQYNHLTQPEDINAANSWINLAISSLERRLGPSSN